MHELQVTERILDVALKFAAGQNVTRIVNIHLRVGELSDVEGEWIQHYFDYLSKGTLAEDAKLEIENVPIVVRCSECQTEFELAKHELNDAVCPQCGDDGGNWTLISGREYTVTNMEVL